MDATLPASREHARAYALTFPGAYEEHPWGQIKLNKRVQELPEPLSEFFCFHLSAFPSATSCLT